MKNTLKISIPFYIVLAISILIGKFKMFLFLTLLTIFHELGHIITGLLLNQKIEKVILLPIGCLTIFNKKVNSNSMIDFIITVMGPIFQIVLFFFIKQDIYLKYNLYLLFFNLLPIYPLDGYKLLNIFLYDIMPFKLVNSFSLYLSMIILFLMFLYRPTSIIIYIVFIVFFIQIIKELKNNKYIFNKFLFERYLYNIKYKNSKLIKGDKLAKMYKNKSHIFLMKNKLIKEDEILGKMFDNP